MAAENKMGTMPEGRLIITMSFPIMLSMLVQALYNIVDSAFVARISEDALTAVSLAFPVQLLMIAVATGAGVGVNALLSRRLGEKKQAEADAVAVNDIFLSICFWLIFAVLGLLFGQRTGAGTWLGASLAVLGMALLSIGPGFQVSSGDWLQLAGAVVWGAHVLLVGLFASRYDPIRLAFLQFATCAAVSLLLALVFEEIHWDAIVQAGPALLYGGLLGVGTGFTLQVVAQKHAIASHAAIILSLEAVFAAIAGALFLAETLHLRGYFGCALMLAGMLVAQLWPRKLAAEARPA